MIRDPEKDKARGKAGQVGKANITELNHSKPDPLLGWFELSKPSRDRQQKVRWKRGRK